ncbi:hypothetical protein D917_08320 [Trichinella nativa]|uniref:Uncharacterized protein n=1 Tax=Trichinella nativa TaxID=6335 RepID=A0A1Y3ERC1_9BILA|nr:hypothetical protein D917_08320 [Trichinella nativa]
MTNKTVYPGSFLLDDLKPLDMHPVLSTIFVLIGTISLICHGFVFCLLCAKRNFDYEQSMIFGTLFSKSDFGCNTLYNSRASLQSYEQLGLHSTCSRY